MANNIKIANRKYYVMVLVILLLFLGYSMFYLTTKPIPWKDEAVTIEGAYNFLTFHKISVYLAPEKFIEYPIYAITSGPPLTLPLALFFKLFGFGIIQARVYMLLWITAFFITIAYIAKKLWGASSGIAALLLIITFTPFHLYGRTVVGELPGLLFTIITFYLLAEKKSYWAGGLLAGIAIAMRPSEYMAIAPAILFFWVIKRWKLRDLIKFGVGVMPGILLFFVFMIPNIFSLKSWITIINFYKNPFGEETQSYVLSNIHLFFTHSTLIYFLMITAVFLVAMYRKKDIFIEQKDLMYLFCLFFLFNTLYFLRSPAWFRYLFPTQIILLLLIFPSIKNLANQALQSSPKVAQMVSVYAIFILIIIQLANLFLFSSLTYSKNAGNMENYLTQKISSNERIFIINDPILSALIEPAKKYSLFQFTGVPLQGENQLARPTIELPKIVIYRNYISENRSFINPYADVLYTHYHEIDNLGQKGYTVLMRNF